MLRLEADSSPIVKPMCCSTLLPALSPCGPPSLRGCSKLVNWGEGKPVPFAFLKDTFELIAEEPKVRPCACQGPSPTGC